MIAVIQLVDQASVRIHGLKEQRQIKSGLLILLGVSHADTENDVSKLVNKICKLRIFPDDNEKMNLDILSVKGEVLLISQFTLLANLKSGNRPDFIAAANKDLANKLYLLFADCLKDQGIPVQTGYFGEHMEINAKLKGPVTITIDSNVL